MLFDSIDFALFLPIVFAIYWSLSRFDIRWQNIFLIVSSYIFYGWWDWRFLGLIVLSSSVDYVIANKIFSTNSSLKKKNLLYLSVVLNLGVLGVFKYCNFFIENFDSLFSLFGSSMLFTRLDWILPVGISFYTFQTMSYTIEVYNGKLKPSKDPFSFFAYVSFFPQLVAGPIERATNFLPQFQRKRHFDYGQGVDGLRQILWGLFKKMVIADNCGIYVDMFFADPSSYNSSTLLLGAIFFAFQIYGDFSGYSDIAIGVGRLFGFNLMQNFAFPYFSRDIAEFWRRWHISLSSWFRDYVYIPLGGSRVGKLLALRNIFIVFVICGFWHGANWTFIIWGILNAVLFVPLFIFNRNRKHLDIIASDGLLPKFSEVIQMLGTFIVVVLLWIFFRSESVGEAIHYISLIFTSSLFSLPSFVDKGTAFCTIILIFFLLIVEWQSRENRHGLEYFLMTWSRGVRLSFYFLIVFIIGMYSSIKPQDFIYFQF